LVRLSLTSLATPKLPAPSSFSASYLSSISSAAPQHTSPKTSRKWRLPSTQESPGERRTKRPTQSEAREF
jgi:hypothetical protein